LPSLQLDRRGFIRTGFIGALAVAAALLGRVFHKASAAESQSSNSQSAGAKATENKL
jgi:hypothetical protein